MLIGIINILGIKSFISQLTSPNIYNENANDSPNIYNENANDSNPLFPHCSY